MFSMPSEFKRAKTNVFWDIGDCPIPKNLSPSLIYHNIKSALVNKGYVNEVSITAYSDKEQNLEDFESSGITLLPTGDKFERFYTILEDSMLWSGEQERRPFNLMLISEDITKDKLYLKSLRFWTERNGNIFIAQPGNKADNLSELLLHHVTAVWLWESLALGGNSIDHRRISQPCRPRSQGVSQRRTNSSTSSTSAKGKTPHQGKIWVPKVKTSDALSSLPPSV